ncbi:MAG: DUF362 domain-containing protein [Polyangia bacterium]
MARVEGRTRREILADAAKAAAAASVAGLAGCFPSVGGRWPDAAAQASCPEPDGGPAAGTFPSVTPTVVEVFRQDSVTSGATNVINADVVAGMVDAGLTALASQVALFNGSSAQDGGAQADNAALSDADGGSAAGDGGQPGSDGGVDNPWQILLPNYRPGQRIGLKVNCLNGLLPTSPAVVHAIIASLRDKLGMDPTTIVVWDRYLSELNDAGKYSVDDLAGAQLLGTLTGPFDTSKGQTEATVTPAGLGYGDAISPPIECQSPRLSRILTDPDLTNITINCPVFKTHGVSTVTAAMKNIYGIIDIPDLYHDSLNAALPKLYALPAIRNSISLTIVDALIAVISGDTSSPPNATPGRILLAQDPVALDSYALVLMSQLRTAAGMKPLVSSLPWIDNAAAAGLGSKNYSLIQV